MDKELMDFLSCIGLIPYYVSRIYMAVLDKLFDKISSEYDLSSIYGLILMNIDLGSGKDSYFVGTIFQYSRNGYVYLTTWDHGVYKPLYHPIKHLFIDSKKSIGKTLKKISSSLYKKKKEVFRKTCICFREKKSYICVFSTLPKLSYDIGYLSMAIKCHGGSIHIRTEDLVKDVLEILRQPFSDLLNEIFNNDVALTRSFMKIVDSCIIDEISELVSRYEIVFPNNIDLQRLMRIYYTSFSGGGHGYSF